MLLCNTVFYSFYGSVFICGGGLGWRAWEANCSHKYPGFWQSLNRLHCHSFAQTDALLFSSKVTLSLLLRRFRSQPVFCEAVLPFLLLLSNWKALFKAVRRKKENILACCHMSCLWRLIWYRAWELLDKELWSCTCQVLPLVFRADPEGSPMWFFFQLLNIWDTSAPLMIFFPCFFTLTVLGGKGVQEHKRILTSTDAYKLCILWGTVCTPFYLRELSWIFLPASAHIFSIRV